MRSKPSTPDHRRRARQITAGLTILALVATACSGTSSSKTDGPAQATATTAVALQPLEQPASRCGTATTKATLVRFQAADGTSLNGVLVGRGSVGVVLAHQYPSDLCGFWPFAAYLAKRGLRALAIDLRCFGRSACPEGHAEGGWSRTWTPPPPSCAAAARPGSGWSGRPWAARRC